MKKLLSGIVICAMSIGLAACGGESTEQTPTSTTTQTDVVQEQNSEEQNGEDQNNAETEPADDAVATEPVLTDAGDLGDYYVAIKDCSFGEDYDGNKIIVINYDFTNNSDEAAAAFVSVSETAFQDGIELETAIVMDSSVYDAGIAQKEIKSGVTLENCQCAFVLTSDSPVEFEMTELFSFDDENKLVKTFEVQ